MVLSWYSKIFFIWCDRWIRTTSRLAWRWPIFLSEVGMRWQEDLRDLITWMDPFSHLTIGSLKLIYIYKYCCRVCLCFSSIQLCIHLQTAFILSSHLSFGLSFGLVPFTTNSIAFFSSHDVFKPVQPPFAQLLTNYSTLWPSCSYLSWRGPGALYLDTILAFVYIFTVGSTIFTWHLLACWQRRTTKTKWYQRNHMWNEKKQVSVSWNMSPDYKKTDGRVSWHGGIQGASRDDRTTSNEMAICTNISVLVVMDANSQG